MSKVKKSKVLAVGWPPTEDKESLVFDEISFASLRMTSGAFSKESLKVESLKV